MEFAKCAECCAVNAAAALSWWNALCAEANPIGNDDQKAANALKENVERTKLFIRNIECAKHVALFSEALERVTTGNSVNRAKSAIQESTKLGQRLMICMGPNAASVGSGACALIAFTSFLKRYLAPGIRGTHTGLSDLDLESEVWDGLEDPAHYSTLVNPAMEYRSNIPNRFWAALDDVDTMEDREGKRTVSRVRSFLGLDDNGKPALLIRTVAGKEPRHFFVPTGWDGFAAAHFRENDLYNDSDPTTHYGFTLDLAAAPIERPGAREVVAEPVSACNTELVRRYS